MPWKAKTLKPIGWVHPDKRSPPPNKHGYDHRWRRLRARILVRDPICTNSQASSQPIGHSD
jgi:hypothetical protein